MADFRLTPPSNPSAMGSIYGADTLATQQPGPGYYDQIVGALESARNFIGGDPTISGGLNLAMMAIPGGPKLRPYANVPDALMGFPRTGPTKPHGATNFKHQQPVKVTLKDGQVMEDAVAGLNPTHALERARRNWPDAKSIDALEVGQLTEPSLIEFFKSLTR